MTHVHPSRLLRAALVIDAAASGTLGSVQAAASSWAASLLGLPAGLVLATGLFMLAYAAALVALARSTTVPGIAARVVIIGNVGWALGCVALAAFSAQVTSVGWGYLLLQALAVAAFAALQGAGLARSTPASPLSSERLNPL